MQRSLFWTPLYRIQKPAKLNQCDLFVKAKLKQTKTPTSNTPPKKKCNSIRCKTCSFVKDGISSCTFENTGQTHIIKQTITCASNNLIFMIQCRKCKSTPNTPAEYIGQTKRALRDRFEEHCRAIPNKTEDAVPKRFNQPRHQLKDIVELIPLELITWTPKENPYVEPANVFTLKRHKLCSNRE